MYKHDGGLTPVVTYVCILVPHTSSCNTVACHHDYVYPLSIQHHVSGEIVTEVTAFADLSVNRVSPVLRKSLSTFCRMAVENMQSLSRLVQLAKSPYARHLLTSSVSM